MLYELWCNIIKFLEYEDLEKLIILGIVSKQHICKMCMFDKKLIINDKIQIVENIFHPYLSIFSDKIYNCGLYINNICTKCCHMKSIKVKASKFEYMTRSDKINHIKYWSKRFKTS